MNLHQQDGVAAAIVGSLLLACSSSLPSRSPDTYREDTRALLGGHSSQFQACYDRALDADPNAGGTVAVEFELAEETGKVEAAEAAEESTASSMLQECVVEAVAGLTLDPPDEERGEAKMIFAFEGH